MSHVNGSCLRLVFVVLRVVGGDKFPKLAGRGHPPSSQFAFAIRSVYRFRLANRAEATQFVSKSLILLEPRSRGIPFPFTQIPF